MKKFSLLFFFLLILPLFSSCELPDYDHEIHQVYQQAEQELHPPAPPEPEPEPKPEPEEEESIPDNIIDGYMWSSRSIYNYSWEDAFSYCEDLREGGYSDWHLPTVNELRTLIQNCPNQEADGLCNMNDACLTDESGCEYDRDNCLCCGYTYLGYYDKFGDGSPLWSSLICQANPIRAWILSFDGGCITTALLGGCSDSDRCVYVRCVRKAD